MRRHHLLRESRTADAGKGTDSRVIAAGRAASVGFGPWSPCEFTRRDCRRCGDDWCRVYTIAWGHESEFPGPDVRRHCDGAAYQPYLVPVSSLAEIQKAVDALPPSEKRELLVFLASRLRAQGDQLPVPRSYSAEKVQDWISQDEADLRRFETSE